MRSFAFFVLAMTACKGYAFAQGAPASVVGRILKIRPPVSIRLANQATWKILTVDGAKDFPVHPDDEVKCGRGGYVLLYLYGRDVEPKPCTSEYPIPYVSTHASDERGLKIGGEVGMNTRIHNLSAFSITRLLVKRENTADAYSDILRGNSIAARSATRLTVGGSPGNCHYDFTAVLSDGSTMKRSVNLCAVSDVDLGR